VRYASTAHDKGGAAGGQSETGDMAHPTESCLFPCRCGSRRLPELDGPVLAGGGQELPVGTETHAEDGASVSLEGEDFLPAQRVPQLHRSVLASGGEAGAVGVEADAGDCSRMSPEGPDFTTGPGIPQLDPAVLVAAGQVLAVGAEAHALHLGRVPFDGES